MNEWSVFLHALEGLWPAGAGLVLDIIGVCILFRTTSVKRVEAEIVFTVMSETTDEIVEWNESYSFGEHKRRLANAGRRVRRNIHWGQFALFLILAGFVLQLLGLLLYGEPHQ